MSVIVFACIGLMMLQKYLNNQHFQSVVFDDVILMLGISVINPPHKFTTKGFEVIIIIKSN